eukprot:8306429-Pyramimonas_sp.AAC.1
MAVSKGRGGGDSPKASSIEVARIGDASLMCPVPARCGRAGMPGAALQGFCTRRTDPSLWSQTRACTLPRAS